MRASNVFRFPLMGRVSRALPTTPLVFSSLWRFPCLAPLIVGIFEWECALSPLILSLLLLCLVRGLVCWVWGWLVSSVENAPWLPSVFISYRTCSCFGPSVEIVVRLLKRTSSKYSWVDRLWGVHCALERINIKPWSWGSCEECGLVS